MAKANHLRYYVGTFGNIPYHFQKMVLNNKNIGSKDTILIAGSPRSGTTWLMEIFATLPGYTYQTEPLNGTTYPEAKKFGFRSRCACDTSHNNWPEGEKYLNKVFNGRATGQLFQYRLEPKTIIKYLAADKIIIKCVRINRITPWIIDRFELRHIFFIIRHPCAVVASQLTTGINGYEKPKPPLRDVVLTADRILDGASEIEGINLGLLKKLEKIETMDEILAVAWCLDNFFLLNFKKPLNWTTVFYEKLLKNDNNYIVSLFNELGEDTPNSAKKVIDIPSLTVPVKSRKIVKDSEKQLSKWKNVLSEKQKSRILEIVSSFGFDFYTQDLEPNYDKISDLTR